MVGSGVLEPAPLSIAHREKFSCVLEVFESYRFELTAQHVSLIITTLVLKYSFFTRI